VVFNLNALRRDNESGGDWSRKNLNGYDWYANVCGTTTRECNGQHATVIAVNSNAPEQCMVLATDFDQPFQLIDPKNANLGVTVTYEANDLICNNKVQVNIRCDPSGSTSIVNAKKVADCSFLLEFASPMGCPIITVPKSTSHEMSSFSVFLLMILCSLCIYCIGYSLFNFHVHGERGLGMLPHPEFWCGTLPETAKEVCGRCWDCAQDLCGAASDRLRGLRNSSSGGSWVPSSFRRSGPGPEYEKINDSARGGVAQSDVEADDEVDDEDNGGAPHKQGKAPRSGAV